MTKHHNFSLHRKASALATLVALVLASRAAELACTPAPLRDISIAVACRALQLSPAILAAAWHVLHALAFGQVGSLLCPLHLLVSFFPLLRYLAGIA